ncbi:MAG: hypothetical protein ACF8XB_21310 [Planctomycetota bacterium JB042]
MRAGCLTALVLFVSAPALDAQILYAKPKDERIEKRYAKHLTTYRGMQVIIGEPKAGITCQPGTVRKTGGSEAKNEMYVADPGDPSFVPYKWEDGRRVKNGKRSVVQFAGDDFPEVKYVDRLQTLRGLANEYEERLAEIESLETQRDAADKGTTPWFGKHGMMLARLDRLQTWLLNMGYPKAAKRLERQIDREKKQVSREATAQREKAAIGSIKGAKVPDAVVEASKKVSNGRDVFGCVESQHLRIVYTGFPDSLAERAIELGEHVIEGFRKDFVDPYRDEDFRDHIPDGRFVEFCFVPEDEHSFENYKIEIYGVGWSNRRKAEELKMSGSSLRRGRARGDAEYVRYWKYKQEGTDVEGIITHSLGHILANLHYARGAGSSNQPWIEEACGYYLSFGHLGRNTVTCFTWNEPSYAKQAQDEGEKTVQEGLRGYFNELAITKGPTLETLAIRTLADMTDADFAKAWSMFDFVSMKLEKSGQIWLRNTCLAASSGNRGKFVERWRRFTEELFPVPPGTDVFSEVDKKWRAYADRGQRKD